MKIAVVVLNYNSLDDTFNCVRQLKKQTGVDLEIIVVDNKSPNKEEIFRLIEFCKTEQCRLCLAEENRGYNAGNNIGLHYAADKGYEYVLIANPDMEFPQPDYVSSLLAEMEQDGEVVAVGSDIVVPGGFHQNPIAFVPEKYVYNFKWIKNLFFENSTLKQQWNDRPERTSYCAVLNGCCLLLRLKFFEQDGFFDEHVFLFGEEKILGRQVERLGKKMLYVGHCQAFHNHKTSKEGSQVARLRHLRHSERVYVKQYSGYSWIGKVILLLMIRLKYFLLYIKYSNY